MAEETRFKPGDRVYMAWRSNETGEEVARRWGTVKSAYPICLLGKIEVDFDDGGNPFETLIEEELLFKEGEVYEPSFYHYDQFAANPQFGYEVCPNCGRVGATHRREDGKKRYVHVTEGIMFSRDVDFCDVEETQP